MFRTFIEQPVFNLLEVIYAMIPGHDLGVAIILFTVVIRLLLWPLVKKQLHHTKDMRKLQPELKKLKKAAAGDRQKEARMQMELYKEHGVKPFSTIGTLIIQIPIFIALYRSVLMLIRDPNTLQTFSYNWVHNLSWIKTIAADTSQFQHTLFGLVNLSKTGLSQAGPYWPAIVLAAIAAAMQFYQSKMLMPDSKDSRKLTTILKDASSGKESDQTEVSAAVSRGMIYFLPGITFLFAVSVASALSLYFFTSSGVGYVQQKIVFREDEEEMHEIAEESAESPNPKPKTRKKKPSAKKKRRKK